MDRGVPKMVRLSIDDLPDPKRLDSLFEVYGRTIIKADVEPTKDRPFQFKSNLYSLPALGLASTIISPCRAPRRLEHIDSDDLVLTVVLSGVRTVSQLNREALLRDGEAILTTCHATGLLAVHSTSKTISMRVPRAVIEPSTADIDAVLLRPIPRNTSALRLLTAYAGAIEQAMASASPELCGVMAKHCHDLFALTVGPTPDAAELARGRGVRAARLHSIKQLIAHNFHNKTLSIGAIAAAHGITSRYVNMLFEETGENFSQHVLEKRLALAAELLGDPRQQDRKISEIAFVCGFGDLSYFNRVFRRRYGQTPSDMRETARRQHRDRTPPPTIAKASAAKPAAFGLVRVFKARYDGVVCANLRARGCSDREQEVVGIGLPRIWRICCSTARSNRTPLRLIEFIVQTSANHIKLGPVVGATDRRRFQRSCGILRNNVHGICA